MDNFVNSDASHLSHRYLLIVWYLGTDFHGSQRQPKLRTVEGEIIQTLKQAEYISKSDAEIGDFKVGMRTDQGVHAREFSFCFTSSKPLYPRLIAAKLPSDIGLVRYGEVPLSFNPRWECLWKEYRYFYPVSGEIQETLDMSSIQEGLSIIQGTHDFRMFTKTDRTRRDKSTSKTIDHASLLQDKDGIIFIFRSQSFSWEQIRRTVHFIIHLGLHEFSLDDLRVRLHSDAGNNKSLKKSPPFPPEGLILWNVEYPKSVLFTPFRVWIQPQEKHLIQSQMFHIQNAHIAQRIQNSLFSDLDHKNKIITGKKITNPKNSQSLSKDQ
ncbi:MAG: tRNA pseudouridine synthase A [Promethearchaeota archaeon]